MLYHRPYYRLSVIVASCRPQLLGLCLAQLRGQYRPPPHEVIVVAEGDPGSMRLLAAHYRVEQFHSRPLAGNCGAAAKDFGIAQAQGEHLVFWDDDNYYEPGALRLLARAAAGVELGVVQTLHWEQDRFLRIPRQFPEGLHPGGIDTMCLCVERTLAGRQRWHQEQQRGTDYRWLRRLLDYRPSHRFLPELVGRHLPCPTTPP